jgi:sugar fermentation stimulation protein A
MKFDSELIPGTLIKRYKRFFADVKLTSGEIITAHTANTGPMTTCFESGRACLLSFHNDPKRQLKYSLEMIKAPTSWIGVNTHLANKLALEAIHNGTIKELQGYQNITPEYKIGNSRLDFMLSNSEKPECFVEVKSVTLLGENNCALFPDTITTRGQKHLRELMDLKKQGYRTVMLFVVQREDVDKFAPAEKIDPEYARLLKKAHQHNIDVLIYQCSLTINQVLISLPIPF